MKILMIIPVFYPAFDYGGPIPVALNFAQHLIARGHEVTVWTTNLMSSKGAKLSSRTEVRNVYGIRTVYLNSVVRYRWTGIAPDLLRYARREFKDFDVIHIYGFREYLTFVAAMWARRIRKPYVLQTLGTIPRITRSRVKKFLFDTLFGHSVLRGATALIAKTPIDREPYLLAGIPSEKIELIPNGISTPPELEELEGGEFRREYDIEEEETLFLFVGRIHPVKGVDLLARAFSKLGEGARLAIVGPDEGYRREIERFVSKAGLRKQVIFTGPLYGPKKWAAYQDADVYILPSIHENFGMTVLEAMICDTPVIVTEGCGIAPQVKDRAGLTVPYDEKILAQAMRTLLINTQLRTELSRGARLLIREEFSWEPVVGDLETLYEKVISIEKKKP